MGAQPFFKPLGPLSLRALAPLAAPPTTMPPLAAASRFASTGVMGGLCLTNLFDHFRGRIPPRFCWRRRKPVGPENACLAAALRRQISANGLPPGAAKARKADRDCQATTAAPLMACSRAACRCCARQNRPTMHPFYLPKKPQNLLPGERSIPNRGQQRIQRSQPALLHQQNISRNASFFN